MGPPRILFHSYFSTQFETMYTKKGKTMMLFVSFALTTLVVDATPDLGQFLTLGTEITKTTLDQTKEHFNIVTELIKKSEMEMIDMSSEIHSLMRDEVSLALEYSDLFLDAKHHLIEAQQKIDALANMVNSAAIDLKSLITGNFTEDIYINIQYQTMANLLADVKNAVSAAKEKHYMAFKIIQGLAPKLPEGYLKFCVKQCFEKDTDFLKNDISDTPKTAENPEDCKTFCQEHDECEFWSLVQTTKECWLKTEDSGRVSNTAVLSGPKVCDKSLKPNCEKVQTSVMEMEEVLQSALDNMDDELNKIDLWQNDAIAIGETIDQDGEFQDNYDTTSFASGIEDLLTSAESYLEK